MTKILKNLVPFYKSVILIVLLLVIQAWCDLALPQYTSDIIDVGIINSGVEHIMPSAVTSEEFNTARMFMTDSEAEIWNSCYTQNGETYNFNEDKEDELEGLDSQMLVPIVLNYQMSSVDEMTLRKLIAEMMGKNPEEINSVPLEQIGSSMGVKLKITRKEQENEKGETETVNLVDVRDMLAAGSANGLMSSDDLLAMRQSTEKTIESMGDSLVKSMGVAYALKCNKESGLDTEKIQTSYLWLEGLKMVAIALVMGLVTIAVSYLAARVGAGVGKNLRKKVFSNVVSFSNAEMDKFSTASLITRSTNDVQQIQMVCAVLLRMLAYAPILGIGGIIKVVKTGAGMGWVIVLAVLVIAGLVAVLMGIAMPKFKLMQKLIDRLNLVSREILTGLSVVRAFGREKTEEKRFDDANRNLTKTQLFTNRVMTFMMPGMSMIMYGLTLLIVWVSAHKIDNGSLQVGEMTAFITYAMMIVMSFLMLTAMSIMLPRAAVAAERIDEVIKTDSSVRDAENTRSLNGHTGVLCFNNVDFSYPGADGKALEDISFTANPGETTAIIGSTGCGKSTLVNLIPRLYDVTGGSITLDGVDIRKLSLQDLRNEIGFVPQKAILFSGTVATNLRFGNRDASNDEIKEAAEIAMAAEFIESKPDKYESTISQGGSNVSGGQKQRLSIARAIAKNPKIFVFDDSFSALDLKTDAALRKALGEKTKDSTVIIVAQRISTILNADNILVLEDGKIVGSGTHRELMKNCDVYMQIAKSQLSDKELELYTKGDEVNE